MDLLVAFALFLIAMVAAVIWKISMVLPLTLGLILFMAVGMKRGFSIGALWQMGMSGTRDSLIVIKVMCVIGFLTAVWRISGTITVFVYYGIQLITPSLFLLIGFLLACLLSYALGTSFGVAGTVGVIFMTLARSGGVDPAITAGILMSGIYFGDRCSPVSSSANLVAGVSGTDIFQNVKMMMKTAMLPLFLTFLIYLGMSFSHPIQQVDASVVSAFEQEFSLSLWAFLPALFMLILPLLKIQVLHSMAVSIVSGMGVAWMVQKVPLLEVLRTCIFGYEAKGEGLGAILNGGGLMSMMEIVIILVISCAYSGIFSGTKMLETLQETLKGTCNRFGRFAVMLCMSIVTAAVFCNQTISTIMCSNLLKKPYLDGGGSLEELAIDMENSVILIACFIPWSIGCSVPLAFFGVGAEALPFAVYMYALPLLYWARKKKWYADKPSVV